MEYRISEEDRHFMQMAIRLSVENVEKGGGPFGAVIVRSGKLVAIGTNRVTSLLDPTAHAEVSAIRAACQKVNDFKLTGCVCYTSCEPCPMCLSALYWAGVDRIFYGNTRTDADGIGFGDDFIYAEIGKPLEERSLPIAQLMRDEALSAFRLWEQKEDKIAY